MMLNSNFLILASSSFTGCGAIMHNINPSHDNHDAPVKKSFKQKCCVTYDLERGINPT